MAYNLRMLGPTSEAHKTRLAYGVQYTAVPGQIVTVPEQSGEILAANGWTRVALSGPSTDRPSGALGKHPAQSGLLFWDETLNGFIVWDGQSWRDPHSGAIV